VKYAIRIPSNDSLERDINELLTRGRRRILHFNVTRHPTAEWVMQQLREVFPEAGR